MRFGPLCDLVRSLDLVAGDGTVHRVERAGGPTDPAALAALHPDWVAAPGRRVAPRGGLRHRLPRPDLRHHARRRAGLRADRAARRRRRGTRCARSSPTSTACARTCTTRSTSARTASGARSSPRATCPTASAARATATSCSSCSRAGGSPTRLINLVTDLFPRITPRLLDMAITGLARKAYTNASYKVFNIGAANAALAYSSEIGVPVDADGHAHPGRRADHRAGRAARRRRRRVPHRADRAALRGRLRRPPGDDARARDDDDRADRARRHRGRLRAARPLRGRALRARRPPALGAGQHAHRQPRLPALAGHVPRRGRPLAGGPRRARPGRRASTGRSPSASACQPARE